MAVACQNFELFFYRHIKTYWVKHMYEKFFGLIERPFTINTDPSYIYLSSVHNEALVHLEYGLLHRASHTVITGEIGTGKTTILKKILKDLPPETKYASIFTTTVDAEEFLDLILIEFSIPHIGIAKAEKLNSLNTFFIDQYARGNRVLLIVDEAQNLSLEVLEELRLLSNLQTDKEFLLQTILVGQPELKKKLNHPRLAQYAQRISVQYHLGPISQLETNQYVEHRLQKAGYSGGKPIFTENGLALIYQHSKGTPRVINLICDQAMVYAYSKGFRHVDETFIRHVIADREKNKKNKESKTDKDISLNVASNPSEVNLKNETLQNLDKRLALLETAYMSISKMLDSCLLDGKATRVIEENTNLKKQVNQQKQDILRLQKQLIIEKEKSNLDQNNKSKTEKTDKRLLSILSRKK